LQNYNFIQNGHEKIRSITAIQTREQTRVIPNQTNPDLVINVLINCIPSGFSSIVGVIL